MTVDKREQIQVPVWLISAILSLLITGFSTWGIISAKSATLELRATHSENNIENLRKEKASVDQFNMLYDKLNAIQQGIGSVNSKLDEHIKNSQ
jgi:hypothetical protein